MEGGMEGREEGRKTELGLVVFTLCMTSSNDNNMLPASV